MRLLRLLMLFIVGGSGFVVAAQAAAGAQESPAVRSELSHLVAGNTPVVSEQGGYGGSGPLPAIAGTLVEKYTTATSDTYQRPDGRMITRVYATPVNFMDASGHWQPIAGSAGGTGQFAGTGSLASLGGFGYTPPPSGGGWNPNCTLTSTEPKSTQCNSNEMSVGYETSTGKTNHWIWGFGKLPKLGPFPHILYAQLSVYLSHTTTTNAAAVGVYRVTDEWNTTYANWENRRQGTPWTTAGGDYSNGSDAAINSSVGSAAGWIHWYPTAMLQGWYNTPNGEGAAQNGILMKDVSEGSTNNTLTFNTPSEGERTPVITFEWTDAGVGYEQGSTMLRTPLTDKMSLGVNAGSGNLQISNNDLEIAGRGLNFSAARTWNSFSAGFVEQYGNGWAGNEPYLTVLPDGSGEYVDSSGAYFVFTKNGSSFMTPSGIPAYLCASGSLAPCPKTLPSGTSYQLVYDQSQTHVNFPPPIPSETFFPKTFATEIVDRYGNTLKAGFTKGYNQPTSWTDTEGRKIVSELKPEVGPLKITDESGSRTLAYHYYGNVLESYTDAAGHTTYYGKGNLIGEIQTPRGEVVKFTYDSDARVTKIQRTIGELHSSGPATTFTYYEGSEVPAACKGTAKATLVKDPDWTKAKAHETLYCANALDRVEQTIDAAGNTTESTYNSLGNVTSTTAAAREAGAKRGVTSLVYDLTGQNLECEVQGTTGEPLTECPTEALEKGYSTSQAYEDTNFAFQPTKTTSPSLQATNLCYYGGTHSCTGKGKEGETGEGGGLRRETQPPAETTKEKEEKKEKPTTIYSYEKDGNVSSSTDFNEHTTSYEYDASGNLKTVIPPSGSGLGKQTITVDADSRPHIIVQCLAESSCTSSDTTTLTYDPLDRVKEAVYTGPGATKTIKYTYNADGGLEKLVDPTGTTTYTLDPLGRVTVEALPGSVSNAYSYDEASNLLSLTDAGGTTHYFYNGLNQLESMYEPGGNCGKEPSKCTTTVHDNDGSLTKTTYPSGASMRYKLDPTTGRILVAEADGTKGETLLSHTYSYYTSINDSPLVFKDTFSGLGIATTESDYSYDALDRLIYAVRDATAEGQTLACYKYEYDGDGNRTRTKTSLTEGCKEEKTVQYHNNSGNELECRITSGETCTNNKETEYSGYKYDGAGNETKITEYGEAGNTSFAFNNLSQLEGLTPPGKAEEKLKYLGSGQGKLTGLGTTTLQNSALGITKQTIEGNASYYARTPSGTMVDERLPGGTSYNPVYDAQGDVIGLLNSTGALAQTVRYGGPYGENTNTSGTLAYSPTNDPFLFQGGYHLAGGNAGAGNVPNGLYHYGQRYYDPTTGRWTQPDPAASPPEYAFAGDDPVNNRDPSGEITTHANEYLTCEALQQENRHDPRNVYYFDRKTYAYCQWVFRSYTRQVVEGLLKIKGSVHFHLTLQDVGCGVIGTAMGVITDGVGAAVVVSSGSGLAAGLGCTGAS